MSGGVTIWWRHDLPNRVTVEQATSEGTEQ